MCGITGIFHFDPSRAVNEVLLKKMTDTLFHRGPDGEGYYGKNHIGLGHRRLTIIDLTTGDQPMFNEDKSIAVIFNGEIYNYIELRDELKKLGCKFHTNSDTEVIIRSYETWGTDCQNKLNGMWAMALWDERKNQLFISRDRIGEKPLFYTVYDGTFLFGSEIKSILAYGCPRVPNLELTELYLSLGYIPAPYTFYKNISKLQAGHYLIVSQNSVQEKKYWDMPEIDEENMTSNKKQVYETFENLLKDSVRIRMRSDVPYGAFLSGGLDSAGIVFLMSEISKEPVRTFTIGSKEKMFDERKLAAQVAEKFKTDHHEYMIEQDGFDEAMQKITHHFDEPFGDSSALPTGAVSKIAAQKVKMVLTGDGGDEVLSGYNSNLVEKFVEQYQYAPFFLRKGMPGMVNSAANLFSGGSRYKLKQVAKALSFSNETFGNRLMAKSWCRPALAKELMLHPEKQIKLSDFISDFFSKYPIKHPFYQLMFFQFKVLLPDDFLAKVDRMSMASSLETRVPFLDYRLVEYMARVHRDVKMEGYERKSVLRNTIGKRLPPALLRAPKKGFSIPLREWFKDKAFEPKLQSLYNSDFGLDQKVIRQITEDNNSGKEDFGNLIWMLFVLKRWMDDSQ
ncbi:MAG: asparagine synthase (glutamine-hydrolyzing) [Bacteroidetes bacterium]|nr:MAG: asparagine synthase (glutamine-hydrolyzing) [Bacteroidota bacterium]